MATPANYPLALRIGDTETVQLTIQDANGAAINISGRTYAAQVRATAESSSVLCSFTCTISGNGSSGTVVCTLPASTTSTLSAGSGIWDLQETNGSVVTTLLSGPVSITQDVTR